MIMKDCGPKPYQNSWLRTKRLVSALPASEMCLTLWWHAVRHLLWTGKA